MAEVAEQLSNALGRPVRYHDVEPEEHRRSMLAAGASPFFADGVAELFAERRRDLDESRVDLSTHRAFGVTPTTFATFARRDAAAFGAGTRPVPTGTGS